MKKILVVTPAFSGGSWICTEKILDKLIKQDYKVLALGLGAIFHKNAKIHYIRIPFPRYDKWGHITTVSSIFAFLWNIPLLIMGVFLATFWAPEIVIYNGLAAGLSLSPYVKFLGKKNIISYHGFISGMSEKKASIIRFFFKTIDMVVVNSYGSRENILQVATEKKIVVNEHFADDIFFDSQKDDKSGDTLTVLYVGRLDSDKLCQSLIKAAEKLAKNSKFEFNFVGVGEFQDRVKKLDGVSKNVHYLGYINDRKELKALYLKADLTWSYADDSYLALPALESLTCGTPIIVPEISVIPEKTEQGVKIQRDLVPKNTGWLVDPFNDKEVLELLVSIQRTGISGTMIEECKKLAHKRYSKKNLDSVGEMINSLGKK